MTPVVREDSVSADLVSLGHVSGAYGVKGWVKVHSYTEPREAILDYAVWMLGPNREAVTVTEGRKHSRTVVAKLEGVDDRDRAASLAGSEIAVDRGGLPDLPEGRYYWSDLIGLDVVLSEDHARVGRVEKMMSTGAHDVMVVRGERERLIPFVYGTTVISVDLENGEVLVDWDRDF